MRIFLYPVLLFLTLANVAKAQTTNGIIAAGAKLTEGQRMYSSSRSHYMIVQPDGNLCIYDSKNSFVWCSMAAKGSGSYLTMQTDGNFVVYDRNNQSAWSTQTQAYFEAKYGTSEWKPVRAVLENDGTLCLYTAANKKVWSSSTGKINVSAVTTSPKTTPVEGYTGPTIRKTLNITLPMSKNEQNVEVEIADGKVIYQSDMSLGKVEDFTNNKGTVSTDGQSRRWPNSTIPYFIPPGNTKREMILAGIKEINDKTNICLVERITEKDYLHFITKNGNWSALGRIGGGQEISIDQANVGTVIHEILHALGFYHAQSREDRDNFVFINFDNIVNDKKHNFQKGGKETLIGAYDFTSIMHYPANAFSKNGQNTIDVRNSRGNQNSIMGQRDGLSPGDIAAVNSIYAPGPCKPGGARPVPVPTSPAPASTTVPQRVVKSEPFVKTKSTVLVNERLNSAVLTSDNSQYQCRITPQNQFIIERITLGTNENGNQIITNRVETWNKAHFQSYIEVKNGMAAPTCFWRVEPKGEYVTMRYGQVKSLKLENDGTLRLYYANTSELFCPYR